MDDLDTAISHHQAGRFDEAEAIFQEILRNVPEDLDALHHLGLLALEKGNVECAVKFIEKAITCNPNVAVFHNSLGNAFKLQGDLDAAEKCFQRAITLDPKLPGVYVNLGAVLQKKGCLDEARACHRRALSIDPDYHLAIKALKSLGNLLLAQGRPEEAVDYHRNAIKEKPDDFDSHLRLFRALFEMGDKIEAQKHYNIWKSGNTHDAADKKTSIRILSSARMNETADFTQNPYIHEFKDVSVLTSDWLVFKGNQIFCEELTGKVLEHMPFIETVATNGDIFADIPEEASFIKQSCILLGGTTQYYRWIVDFLPRLALLERHEEIRDLPLLVNGDLANFQKQSLEALNIPRDRLIKADNSVHLSCHHLFVPTLLIYDQCLHPDAIDWLRRSFQKFFNSDHRHSGEYVFVSRQDAERRRLLNEQELIEALVPLGFEVVIPGTLDFKEQVRIFSQAKLIVGPHGAGLVNMVFSPDGVQIIELQHRNRPSSTMANLASSLRIPLKTIFGEAIKLEPFASPPELQMADYTVDVKAVVTEVQNTIRGHRQPNEKIL